MSSLAGRLVFVMFEGRVYHDAYRPLFNCFIELTKRLGSNLRHPAQKESCFVDWYIVCLWSWRQFYPLKVTEITRVRHHWTGRINLYNNKIITDNRLCALSKFWAAHTVRVFVWEACKLTSGVLSRLEVACFCNVIQVQASGSSQAQAQHVFVSRQ